MVGGGGGAAAAMHQVGLLGAQIGRDEWVALCRSECTPAYRMHNAFDTVASRLGSDALAPQVSGASLVIST